MVGSSQPNTYGYGTSRGLEAITQAIRFRTPTVLRFDGLRVKIYPNDHRPAHVHVVGAEWEAVFNLHCPNGPPELRESYGFRQHEVNDIRNALAGKIGQLCEEWRKIHGSD